MKLDRLFRFAASLTSVVEGCGYEAWIFYLSMP